MLIGTEYAHVSVARSIRADMANGWLLRHAWVVVEHLPQLLGQPLT